MKKTPNPDLPMAFTIRKHKRSMMSITMNQANIIVISAQPD